MRKATLLLFVALLGFSFAASAQKDIPNYSFEDFTGTGQKMKPVSWDTLGGGKYFSVEKVDYFRNQEPWTRDVLWGEKALGMSIDTISMDTLHGLVRAPQASTSFAYDKRAKWFSMYMGFFPALQGERWAVTIHLTRWNADSNWRDTLMKGTWLPTSANPIEPWGHRKVDMRNNYDIDMIGNPDSAHIYILGTTGTFNTSGQRVYSFNTVTYIDNLNFFTDEQEPAGIELAQESNISDVITYPNPAVNNLTFQYNTVNSGYVTLKVYDLSGREVANVLNERQAAGTHQATLNVSNLDAGLYIYRLQSGSSVKTGKIQVNR